MNYLAKSNLLKLWANKKIQGIFVVFLVLAASAIFALRYLPAFTIPNFYAEDGKVFTENALHKNPFQALATGFNGYLISGLYILVELSVGIYKLFDLSFYQLPLVLAVASCLFLGLTVALPYILLRKQLGTIITLLAVLFGAFVAIPSFDYAIIGTIGNLKFLFLYWAFLFCLYRNYHAKSKTRVIVTDLILLLCILTYAPAIALLPFVLWPYRSELISAIKKRKVPRQLLPYLISFIILCFISAVYLAVVYLKGVPKIPGYLDTPYNYHATPKIAYRVTWYEWLFPISPTLRDMVTGGLLLLTTYVGLMYKRNRFIFVFSFWAIFIGTISFVVNRPGISEYFMTYGPNPDQFFYAQTLIFMVLSLWLVKPLIDKLKWPNLVAFLFSIFIFMWWSFYGTGSYGKNRIIYEHLGTAKQNLTQICKQAGDTVVLQSYPTKDWKWVLDKKVACEK